MFRSHDLIPSEAMGREMHVWRFGDFGAPLIVFPSASGMAHEWDAHGMVEALAELIDGGKLKLYCIESNVAEAWRPSSASSSRNWSRASETTAARRTSVLPPAGRALGLTTPATSR